MRADRLLAELMLLQTHGKLSAAALARELEVSDRTIYRDMMALSTSGVPVYAEQGVHGGFRLVDGYRTQLTGLNDQELRALFALNIPSVLDGLGMDENLSSAMRKLQAALSAERGEAGGWMQQRFLFDPQPWKMDEKAQVQTKTLLQRIQQAVWEDQVIQLDLQFIPHGELKDLKVAPYALVLKDNRWYVIAQRNGHFQPYALTEILAVRVEEENFSRVPEFDLVQFWNDWLQLTVESRGRYEVLIIVAEKDWRMVSQQLNPFVIDPGRVERGMRKVQLCFAHLVEARGCLLAFGGAVKVLNPEPLRLSVQDFAEQIILRYAKESGH